MRFEWSSVIPAPVAAVFAFHEAPGALARLTPPWEPVRVRGGGGSLAPGTRVLLELRLGPFRLEWEAEHTLYEKDVLFQDVARRGPFRRWTHTHRFFPTPEGHTRLVDEIDLELPLGAPGALLGGALVRRRLERLFRFRHQATREACAPHP